MALFSARLHRAHSAGAFQIGNPLTSIARRAGRAAVREQADVMIGNIKSITPHSHSRPWIARSPRHPKARPRTSAAACVPHGSRTI
ncbi:hypothetical protein PCAR4_440016 [Paraburkholderia caribensis]|nr:hypothetical protein PCAR4_440016 [Paraburkholderia caribensis]